jgi:hypothetical protein
VRQNFFGQAGGQRFNPAQLHQLKTGAYQTLGKNTLGFGINFAGAKFELSWDNSLILDNG